MLTQFSADIQEIMSECRVLLVNKQSDYGPGNISRFGLPGLVVRLNDKMERLINLAWGGKKPKNESVEDTLMDMCCYAVIGLMVQRGKWPKGGSDNAD